VKRKRLILYSYQFLDSSISNLNKNSNAPEIPCHRVINSDGRVGGFARGTKEKIKILEGEGIIVKNGKIDLKKYSFN
jgi:alkylated DNA nucleotide flippase Atl1